MNKDSFDVIIIGGGPAGSTAAAFARQRGFQTLVLEKEIFPRFRIGESLLPHGNEIFRASGVWPKLEQAGFIVKRGAMFCTADGEAEREVIFANGIVPGLEATLQVERSRFDSILLEHARDLGAQVRLRCTVTRVNNTMRGVAVEFRDQYGESRTVEARWLLDGSGRDRGFQVPLKREQDDPGLPRRVAIYTHLRGVRRRDGDRAGHTIIVRLPDGWFWLIPIDQERTSVGLVTTTDVMRNAGVTPAELFRREIASSPKLRELLDGADALLEFKVTADYSYFHRELAQNRTVLLGDAAGFFDPIFSSGVYLATHSARTAVELISRADRSHRPLDQGECRRYTREIKRHANVFHRLITAFYDNASFAVFMHPQPPLSIDRGVNAIVAGHSRLIWPIWWRFQLFLLVCRLQRRFAIVPRLKSTSPSDPTLPLGPSVCPRTT